MSAEVEASAASEEPPWLVHGRTLTLLAAMAAAVHLAPKKNKLPGLWLKLAPPLLDLLPAQLRDARCKAQSCGGESSMTGSDHDPGFPPLRKKFGWLLSEV